MAVRSVRARVVSFCTKFMCFPVELRVSLSRWFPCSGDDLQSVQDDLQSDINQIQTWLQANRLQLNVSKSAIMMLGSWKKLRDRCVSIYLNGELNGKALTQVTTICYLGVIIDQNLTWTSHVNCVLRKVRCKLCVLQRLRPLPGRLLSQLYQAFILPVFDYCDVVWMPTTAVLLNCLERFHSRILQGLSDCSPFVKLTLMERRRSLSIASSLFTIFA